MMPHYPRGFPPARSLARTFSTHLLEMADEPDPTEFGNYEQPRFQMEAFLIYAKSANASDRELALQNVCDTFRFVDLENTIMNMELVFHVFEDVFAKDEDTQMRCLLLEQIPGLFNDLLKQNHLLKRWETLLFDVVTRSLDHSSDQVRKCSNGAIDLLLEQGALTSDILQDVICPALLKQTLSLQPHSTHFISDEQRLDAVTLLCKIVTHNGVLSRRWIFDNFAGRFTTLLQDSVFHIRKACVSILGQLAKQFGQQFTERVIAPFLISLSEDPVWGVRKACCEVFVDVANNCSLHVKTSQLAPCFIVLLNDSSRWVSCVAYQKLGQLIATFADSTHAGLRIRDGRVTDLKNSEGACSCSSSQSAEADDEVQPAAWDFKKLPPGTVLPPVRQYEPRVFTPPAVQTNDHVLDELTGLLDSWSINCSSDSASRASPSLMDELLMPGGAAAACSTHDDLTKLIFENEDNFLEDVDDMPMEPEEEQCRQSGHSSPADDESEYSELLFWSVGHSEVDLDSYGRTAKPTNEADVYLRNRIDALYRCPAEFCSDDEDDLENACAARIPASRKSSKGSLDESEKNQLEVNSNEKEEAKKTMKDGTNKEAALALTVDDDDDMNVPKELLDVFLEMVANGAKEGDVNRHCAHNFPAVAYTVGRHNWPHIKETYYRLASDVQWRVRQTVAMSIHEVAAIIGEKNTGEDLIPIFEKFAKDVEEVRLGLLKHLCDFLKLVSLGTRRELLTMLVNFLHSGRDNERNWRFRLEYTKQCISLCSFYENADINSHIAAIALTLANDRVADVRKEAAALLACILSRFLAEEWPRDTQRAHQMTVTTSFVEDITKGFARSKSWQRRQTFLYFCCQCLERCEIPRQQFEELLADELLQLSADSVANVRIVFARVMLNVRGGRWFVSTERRERARELLLALTNDGDADCRREARTALGLEDTESNLEEKGRADRLREQEDQILLKWRCDVDMDIDNTY